MNLVDVKDVLSLEDLCLLSYDCPGPTFNDTPGNRPSLFPDQGPRQKTSPGYVAGVGQESQPIFVGEDVLNQKLRSRKG